MEGSVTQEQSGGNWDSRTLEHRGKWWKLERKGAGSWGEIVRKKEH